MASCPFPHTAAGAAAAAGWPGSAPSRPHGPATVDKDEARDWLEMFYAETSGGQRPALERRWSEITAEIASTGSYTHSPAELRWGARVSWRQSVRCVGRARWQSLVVRDARSARSIAAVAAELVEHLRFATNAGRIRSTITVFAADDAVGPRVRVANDQLIRYAGHRRADGTILGDPRYAGFSDLLRRYGWTPPSPPTAFDVLPWLVETRGSRPQVVPVPAEVVLEVPISHPTLPWFTELGLRWHAVPVISNMRLRIGGVDHSCAPFNGFYLVDEIATRNFGDRDRYNQLPTIATRMGVDPTTDSFWQLRAAVELNTAVLHSFCAAGVSIAEPVAESNLFAEFARREEAAGRPVYGDWSWINGHLAGTFGAAWHRYYDPAEPNPNYWLDPLARDLSRGHVAGLHLAGAPTPSMLAHRRPTSP